MQIIMRKGVIIRFNEDRSENIREDEIHGHENV